MPEVRGFLTVSASHLPQAFAERLLKHSAALDKGIILAGSSGFFAQSSYTAPRGHAPR